MAQIECCDAVSLADNSRHQHQLVIRVGSARTPTVIESNRDRDFCKAVQYLKDVRVGQGIAMIIERV